MVTMQESVIKNSTCLDSVCASVQREDDGGKRYMLLGIAESKVGRSGENIGLSTRSNEVYVNESESSDSESSSRTIRLITLLSKRSMAKRRTGNRK